MSTVLIVDDCGRMRRIIRNIVESGVFGVTILELSDGFEVVDYVRTFHVKLVILDMVLGYENGEDVLKSLISSELPVSVIVLSGNYCEDSFTEIPCVKAVFSKPVDPVVFLDAIKAVLEDT